MNKYQKAYIKARAAYETAAELDEACKTKVLNDNEFFSVVPERKQRTRITDPKRDFLMSDKDFTEYCKLCFAEHKKAGLNPKHYNEVVTYPYHEKLMQAEHDLIEWGLSVIKTLPEYKKHEKDIATLRKHLTDRKVKNKMIDLTMRVSS